MTAPTLYRLRYAIAFAGEFVPLWRHPIHWLEFFRLGLDDFDSGDAADNMADYTPEEAASESAYYWREE